MNRIAIVLLGLSACGSEPTDPVYPPPSTIFCNTPGATRCAGPWLQTCTNNTWMPTVDCSLSGATCTQSATPGVFACEVVTGCTQPGAERCNNDVIETCIGTDWVAGQDCALTGGTCATNGSTATCEAAGCTGAQLDDTTCAGDLVLLCDGTSWALDEDCSERLPPEICEIDAISGDAGCVVNTAAACTAVELGATKCDEDLLLECNGTYYTEKEDCGATGKVCEEFFTGVARCEDVVPPAGLFDSCTGTGQGNCESADMVCGQVTLLSDGDLCLIDCSSNPSLCTTITVDNEPIAGYCEPGTIDGGTSFSDVPFCFWVSDRGGMCLFNDDGCSGTDMACLTVTEGLNPECKLNCPAAQVGTSPSACAGQQCLRAPYVEIEQQGGADRACFTEGGPTECSPTYECQLVNTDTTATLLCARPAGLCGNEAPAAGPFSNQTSLSSWIDDDTNTCELLGADQYCGADDAAGAVNECTGSGFAFRYDPAIPCAGFDDFVGCFGLGECITFDGFAYECGIGINVCQRFCTNPDGSDAGTCDGGETCQVPAYPIGRPAIEFDASGDFVDCSSNPSICSPGFTCDSTTFSDATICTKVRSVCGP